MNSLVEIPADETMGGGYASDPGNLESSTMPPVLIEEITQPTIGKKRRRKRKNDMDEGLEGEAALARKKKEITECEHVDREFYAKGMCKNCYHKKGRMKPAECCPDKKMYALNFCQNCYMKHYGKEKRKENKVTKERRASVTKKDFGAEDSNKESSDEKVLGTRGKKKSASKR